MDINKLNPLNFLGLTKKAERTEKVDKNSRSSMDKYAVESSRDQGNDSVSISTEALIKQAQVEARQEMEQVREEKVNQIKEKISSGQYSVSAEDLAAAILKGKPDIYQELK